MAQKLRVVPLGGLGEIGKNMMALELEDDLLIIDAGVMFPEEEMLGIDLVIPDVSYVERRRHKLRGIIITHGHEDHTGALPYVLPRIPAPIYCTRLSRGLIAVKLREHGLLEQADLRVVNYGERIRLGAFTVEFVRVTHSIPDSAALAIETPLGLVFHTGDFKLDHTPVMGLPTDLQRIAQLGRQGVLLMLSDSTYADVPGYTPSERIVGETLWKIMATSPGRVIVATFASLISRVQQVVDAATACGRRVFVTGRSMLENVAMALEQGYLETDQDLLAPMERMRGLKPHQVVIVTTGAQGEPTSALVRMANRDHRFVEIQPGDTVILSSSPIPGNEVLVNRTISNLYRLGARVVHSRMADVHVRGHAAQEELKLMLGLVRPQFFVPIHGEYRHLAQHAELARLMGVKAENVFILEDGDILEIDGSGGRVVGRAPADLVYVDGLAVGVGHVVLRDRRHLASDGILVALVTVDKHTGRLLGPPDLVSRGFVEDLSGPLLEKARRVVMEAVASREGAIDRAELASRLHDALLAFLYNETRRRPMILPLTVEV
ncbi:MAG: ribonuclease J [Dehalococcoidia bacterium]|jgi:ribonuclease J|nr:ribonuclease J [Dehalococcoidia bacterium]